MKRLFWRSLWLLLLLMSVALGAHAQGSEEDTATARDLAIKGQKALDAGNYEKAADLFRRAESLHHAPSILVGLARAYKGMGKYVRARETYNKVIREKLPANATEPFKRAQKDAKSEVGEVEKMIAWVTISVAGPSEPVVKLDGEQVPAAALGVRRAVDPGDHVVTATADGYLAGQDTFSVEPKGSAQVSLTLELDPTASADGEPGGTGPDDADDGELQRILAFVALGVGGAGLIVGGITGGLAMGKHGDLEESCPDSQCPPDQEDTLDSFRTMGTVSTIGFIAGGVFAATGVVLLLTAPSAEEPEAAEVTARFGPGSVSATVRF